MKNALPFIGLVLILAASSCRRQDPRQNSNPHPQAITEKNQPPPSPPPPAPRSDGATGTDSTGRPSDSSGGTTGQPKAEPAR